MNGSTAASESSRFLLKASVSYGVTEGHNWGLSRYNATAYNSSLGGNPNKALVKSRNQSHYIIKENVTYPKLAT